MSGSEPLWRRVAGLYLSGIPADAGERLSTRAAAPGSGAPAGDGDPTQEIIDLGEALDLVTLAQGYRSPAVPLLLRALIRAVRQTAAARAEANVAAEAAMPQPEASAPEAAAAEPAESAAPAATEARKAEEPEAPAPKAAAAETAAEVSTSAALEKRVEETDQKLAALTGAVSQLVDVLQRRSRSNGGIDRRKAPRFSGANAKLFVHGQAYTVLNWSKGGFLIRIAETDRFSRGGFDFHFVLDLPDETIEFQGRARPIRIERTTLAAEFAALDAAAAAKIGAIADRLVAGG